MTSNIDRAADAINAWAKEGNELNPHVGSPYDIARRLADAGLLATDLPEPTRVGPDFTHWGPVALERDTGAIAIGVSGPYTQDPDEARAWAEYLAAAAHAEQEAGE